jgi:cell division protein FtsW
MQEQDTANLGKGSQYDFVGSIMRGDYWIWGVYIFLACFSAVEIFSATSQLTFRGGYASDPAFRHITFLLAGAVLLLISQSMSLTAIRAWDKLFYVGGFFLCIATIFMGTEQKGAARSIAGLQPVEVCKLGVIMVLCALVTARDATFHYISFYRTKTQRRRYWTYLFVIGLIAIPIATQNLSSALIICMASFGIMFLGGVNGRYLWWTVGAAVALGILGMVALRVVYETNGGEQNARTAEMEQAENGSSMRSLGRVTTWANRIYDHSDKPLWEEDMSGKKSQEIYSHMAIANSYPFGRFIGNSRMRDFLPEAFSDYIFAIIFEEGGPIMALLVLSLYLVLFIRCYILSKRTESLYIRLMMVGLPLIIVIQALIHIGVCTGAMFVTGQPLPLISRGGSSIFGTSISFGILLALSRIIRQEQIERAQLAAEEAASEAPDNDEIPEEEITDVSES